ncbi:phosphatase 2C-like domain-containing protein [Schizophyllum fasciatum]
MTGASEPRSPASAREAADVQSIYDAMCARGIASSEAMGLEVHHSSLRGLKAANEDRVVVHECALGLLVAIFDGHYSDELSDYAAKALPPQLCERIERRAAQAGGDLSAAVPTALSSGIQDFDRALIEEVYKLFPEGEETDWTDEYWDDEYYIYETIGRGKEDERFRTVRRATTGTAALVAFIDKAKKNIWVASLGDSEAVLGRIEDGELRAIPLNDLHNASNPREVARLEAEHDGEPPVIYDGRTMRQLALTRALGNYQMKLDHFFAYKFLRAAYPSCVIGLQFEFWKERGLEHYHPPYISNTPTVERHALLPGDVLLFASDGLRDALHRRGVEDGKVPQAMMALAGAEAPGTPSMLPALSDRLGHSLIPIQEESDNIADRVVRNVLFGSDEGKMSEELSLVDDNPYGRNRDDISVTVLAYDGGRSLALPA